MNRKRHQNLKRVASVGMTYAMLTVVEDLGTVFKSTFRRRVRCTCKCGNIVDIFLDKLKSGNTKSCGCLKDAARVRNGIANKTHGEVGTLTYNSWKSMLQRVRGKSWTYKNKRMTCDPSWYVYENFKRDMGTRPSRKHSLDKDMRKPGNMHYSKDTCMWATSKQQNNCKSDNRVKIYLVSELQNDKQDQTSKTSGKP